MTLWRDISLAVAALGAGPERIRRDLNLLGLLFESLVIRDLRVYAQASEGQVFHYRDSYGVEVDAIVQVPDGRWIAFHSDRSRDRRLSVNGHHCSSATLASSFQLSAMQSK